MEIVYGLICVNLILGGGCAVAALIDLIRERREERRIRKQFATRLIGAGVIR